MSEATNTENPIEDPEIQRIIDQIKPNFDQYKENSTGDQEELRRNIQTGITIFTGRAEIWAARPQMNKTEKVEPLIKAGFKKLSEIYQTEDELKLVNEVLDEVTTRETKAQEEKGIQPTLTKYVEKHRSILE